VFGTAPRTHRPVLLILVFGAFLAIVGITAASQSTIVSSNFDAIALDTIVGSDRTAVEHFASQLQVGDVTTGATVTPERQAVLDAAVADLTTTAGVQRIELVRADGVPLAATSPATRGGLPAPSTDARPDAAIVPAAEAGAAVDDLGKPMILRERLPITDLDGHVLAVATVYRDAEPILARLDAIRWQVVVVTLTAAAIAAVLLFFIFRSAQGRLTRQTKALIEATRTDALTGTLNHGALVADLAVRIESSKDAGEPIGVALLDLDNFTLLNDHHGHRVGDDALLTVLDALEDAAPASAVIGRYGPDEFLVIVPADAIQALEPAIQRVRTTLVDRSLDVGAPDRLPITVSAGIAAYPRDATSLTVLLATVAATLGSAKASGGDDVRVAGADDGATTTSSSFDVLQGLVFAIDTKDRYTKRHSEDVSRYAVFLAERLGLDDATIATIRVAGLLHDVGKIGIPDTVLRKPSRLTAEEQEIVQQHVVLGDMIVRDLPDVDLVRRGIRHHHERWDGKGYIDRLEGAEIPLIARVLAVGDTFSAMTTSRPYRKALDVREAITRLVDASGSQLDQDLVSAFVQGLETAADPPLPGNGAGTQLWTPRAVA
jgi:diguanylate cyclase (GGDEF)-like protein